LALKGPDPQSHKPEQTGPKSISVMHFDIGQHGKTRSRSVHLHKAVDTSIVEEPDKAASLKDGYSSPPVPSTRSSSLPTGKENSGSIRHYRSMLDVEGPPKLGPLKPLTYEEIHLEEPEPKQAIR